MNGKEKRLSQIFSHKTGKSLIVPVDDSLIFGPFAGLLNIDEKLNSINAGNPNAILAFKGTYKNHGTTIMDCGWICNLSISTINSLHTNKVINESIIDALFIGADCVAVHSNITSKYESDMLLHLNKIVAESESYGMPVLSIVYPRTENSNGTDNNYLLMKKGILLNTQNLYVIVLE